jgi:hypothetical protein
MTLQELMAETQSDAVRRLDIAWTKFEDEARAEHAGGVRRSIAGWLVHLGARLDRGAAEPAVLTTRRAS